MAPRANWKGFLRLSLVTCPVALYPATSESEKISFNQLNRKTGHRIKYAKVDADTGEEVANEDIVKGYKVDTDTFIEEQDSLCAGHGAQRRDGSRDRLPTPRDFSSRNYRRQCSHAALCSLVGASDSGTFWHN
jgi:Ku70/Ku80 beta-barrel domain